MDKEQVIRAWKDEEFRSGLSESELSSLPQNPAGIVELSGADMEGVGGFTVDTRNIMTYLTLCYVCPVATRNGCNVQ